MEIQDYSARYDALDVKRRRLFLKTIRYWLDLSYTTFYSKLQGNSLRRIEKFVIEKVLEELEHKDGVQQIIKFDFSFNLKNGPKIEKSCTCTTK